MCVLFQPHRYTRTRDLIDDFARSFSDADELVVIDIYPAGEAVLEGIHSENLCQKIREEGKLSEIVDTEVKHKEIGDWRNRAAKNHEIAAVIENIEERDYIKK